MSRGTTTSRLIAFAGLFLLCGTAQAVVPVAPSNLTATAVSTTQINLGWTDNSNNETSFKIERKTGASGTYAQIATVGTNVTTFNNTGLASGTVYFYRVRASNSSGNSAYTNEASATTQVPDTTAPTAPTGLTAAATKPNQIDLSWTASTDDVAVTGYYIARCQGAGCTTYDTFLIASTTGTSFSDVGIAASMSYTYQVRAHDAAGNVGPYSAVSATTLSTLSGPVAAYAFDEGTGVTTQDFSGNNNSGTLGGGVTWSAQGKFGSALVFNGSSLVTIAPTASLNLTNGMTLEAWVFPTATSTGSPTVVAKDWTSQLSAYVLSSGNFSYGPRIAFAAPDGIPFGTNGPPDLPLNTWSHLAGTYDSGTTNMRIYVNGALRVSVAISSGPQMLTTTGAVHIGGSAVTASNEFFVGRIDEVRIYNRALSQAEIQADMATPSSGPPPDTTPPSAPSALSASAASTTQINLGWTASTDNVGVAGYRVERCQGAGCGTFAQIATPIATTFSDTGLTAGTSYSYRVRAADSAGNLSAYSNVASATTVAAQAQMYFIHPDHLNAPRMIASSTGTTVWRWDQTEPFGNSVPNSDPDGDGIPFDFPLRFPGQYFDRETNINYNYFRNYSVDTGRYLEADPIGLRAGPNAYLYVFGNSLGSIDPFGLLKCSYNPPNFDPRGCIFLGITTPTETPLTKEEPTGEKWFSRTRLPDYRIKIKGNKPNPKLPGGGLPIGLDEFELLGYWVIEIGYQEYTKYKQTMYEMQEIWWCPGPNQCTPDDKDIYIDVKCFSDWTPYDTRKDWWMKGYYESLNAPANDGSGF